MMYGDVLFKCPVVYYSQYLADEGYVVYPYLFDYKPSLHQYEDPAGPYDDLSFVLGEPLPRSGQKGLSDELQLLSRTAINIFSHFARTG
ncbi:hypothetical protein HPB48_001946 [Haemaphysalis longicornis]|uniref:Carboxylesterase type B domain-containing protein n=1 Tax=Haemaphysalis longicornis TaxID=44386 RepID=A0A9J6G4B8_HAELO|nr:hypothetical protein HPB48_001946 [Haemaphysalis longicornis]